MVINVGTFRGVVALRPSQLGLAIEGRKPYLCVVDYYIGLARKIGLGLGQSRKVSPKGVVKEVSQ